MNLVNSHIVGTSSVSEKWNVDQILGPFWSQIGPKLIGQYIGFRLFSWKGSTVFTWNLIYKLVGATFLGV